MCALGLVRDVEELCELAQLVGRIVADRARDFERADAWSVSKQQLGARDLGADKSAVELNVVAYEELGLIERQPHPTDRRVKNLVLTAKGKRVKKAIPNMLWNGPNTFSTLTDSQRTTITGVLAELVASAGHSDPSNRSAPTTVPAGP